MLFTYQTLNMLKIFIFKHLLFYLQFYCTYEKVNSIEIILEQIIISVNKTNLNENWIQMLTCLPSTSEVENSGLCSGRTSIIMNYFFEVPWSSTRWQHIVYMLVIYRDFLEIVIPNQFKFAMLRLLIGLA